MSENEANQKSAIGDRRFPRISFRTIQSASVFLLMIALCIYSAARTDTFLTWRNLVETLLTNASYLGIIACGMTFVMIAGGFDLSVASITAVCSVLAVLLLQGLASHGAGVAIPVALLGTLAVGCLLGAVNGALISYVGVNPFVTTLSTLLVFRGIGLLITRGGQSIQVPLSVKESYSTLYWGRVNLFGSSAHQVTVPILIFLGVFLLSVYLLRFTRFGHYVYAVGGNENASWLAGINTPLVKMATYVLCGLTCAIAAALYCSMSGTAQASSYEGLEMMVIASVIVGGTPLGGGSGSLLCTLNGLLLLSVIENLLSQFGVSEEFRKIVRGLIILVVVAVDGLVRGARAKQRR
jgi:ribose transport system permease protein